MSITVEMNKDIRKNKNKLIGSFSAREVAHIGMAVVSSTLVKMYLFPEISLMSEEMCFLSIIISIPFAASGWLKFYDMYIDQFFKKHWKDITAPKKRIYDNGLNIKRQPVKTKPSKDASLKRMI